MNRWDEFTLEERSDIHHALRMLTTHPLTSEEEREHLTKLADEVWDYHAKKVADEQAA